MNVIPVDLGSVIGVALDAVRPAADARRVQLRSELVTSARVTTGDPRRLQQIVWNLLANAVKFTQAGGSVTVVLRDRGPNDVQIGVQDDGVGIDPAFLPHVFERFRQADGSVSRKHGGLGLGLAIVRHLVELHGGSVRAESPGLGKGATFTVDLPRMHPGTAAELPEEAGHRMAKVTAVEARARLAGCRALVVDDEDDARELVATILRAAGAEVNTAASVAEALHHLDASPPHILLADIGMPGTDGYALIREVRRRDAEKGEHLPAAAVTAYAGDADRERAIGVGFDVHVAKPISAAAIIAAVLKLCGNADEVRAANPAASTS